MELGETDGTGTGGTGHVAGDFRRLSIDLRGGTRGRRREREREGEGERGRQERGSKQIRTEEIIGRRRRLEDFMERKRQGKDHF